MATRQGEAEQAMDFLEAELAHFVHLLNRKAADDTVATLHTWAGGPPAGT